MTETRWPQRVLYASSIDLSIPDGPGVNEREFVASLRERFGPEVQVVAARPTRTAPPELAGTAFHPVLPIGRDPIGLIRHQRALASTLRRVLTTRPPELVILRPSVYPRALSVVMREFPGIPYVLKTLGEGTMAGFKGAGLARRVAHLCFGDGHERALDALVAGALGIDACTTALRDAIIRRYALDPAQVALVENATNVSRFRPAPRAEARAALGLGRFEQVLGYVGGVPWERGGLEIIRAVARCRDRFPKLGGVVVGGGEGLDRLKAEAAALGVADRCVFPGWVPYDTVPQWVNAFDVGVALDEPGHLALVGNSNQKVRQYLACGRPVIQTPGGQLPIQAEGLGTEVPAGDFEAFLASVMDWLARPPSARPEFEARARRFAEERLGTATTLEARLAFWRRRREGRVQ